MRFGPELHPIGVTFRLWAPAAKRVDLVLDRASSDAGPRPMAGTKPRARRGRGHAVQISHRWRHRGPRPGLAFPAADVSGPSEVIDHDQFAGRPSDWRGRPWEDAAFLELHVGTFTPGGSFRAAIERLDHVRDTGLTAIELMPLADFSGRRNWGYDGVLLYAPDSAYGRPDDLKALIDAAHQRGLMVFLDVVYNHFGPEGNYLGRYAPGFFTTAQTPWGQRHRLSRAAGARLRHRECAALAASIIASTACGSMRSMPSSSRAQPSILHDLSRAVGELAPPPGGTIHLVLENDDNRASLLDPRSDPPRGKYRAQWNDDYHHAWHVLLARREATAIMSDYARSARQHIARVLSSGFAYQGEASPHRGGRRVANLPARCRRRPSLISCRTTTRSATAPLGDRLSTQAMSARSKQRLPSRCSRRCRRSCSWARNGDRHSRSRFSATFKGELADAVRKGRREEFKSAYAKLGDEIPDPLEEQTFRSAVLDWDARENRSRKR